MMEKQSRLETDSGRCKDTQTIGRRQQKRNSVTVLLEIAPALVEARRAERACGSVERVLCWVVQ